jgi:hypothetical protein
LSNGKQTSPDFREGSSFDFYKPHDSHGLSNWPPSLTRQEFAEDSDINTIMRRFESNGGRFPGDVNPREPQYLDLTAMPSDLMGTMAMLSDAESAFMSLPAAVRREFDNDPLQFVDFASDPENVPQMRTWGLAPPEPVPEAPPAPQRVVIVDDPASPASAGKASPAAP